MGTQDLVSEEWKKNANEQEVKRAFIGDNNWGERLDRILRYGLVD